MTKRTPKPFESPYDEIVNMTTRETKKPGKTGFIYHKTFLGKDLTKQFLLCYKNCESALSVASKRPLVSAVKGKTYFSFELSNKSRPVNKDIYESAANIVGTDSTGAPITKVDQFFTNLLSNKIDASKPDDITESVYRIVMDFACCTDLFSKSGKKQVGTYFEKFIGHIYATFFQKEPEKDLMTNPIDGECETIPTDFIFDEGEGQPKFHIPAKFTTRDRVVQVWAQQRLIDGTFGVGRYHCLMTCCCETDFNNNKVTEVCVDGQWKNYQLYISQILRAYYLDPPAPYVALNSNYPPIHVKTFGEFFSEGKTLGK